MNKLSANKENGDRLIDGEQDGSWGLERFSKKEKGLTDMDYSMVIARGRKV